MEPEDEIELGLRFFESRISQDARLRVKRWHRLTDHGGYDVTISGNTKEIGTSLSDEFLADLPNTKPYQEALNDYIGCLHYRAESLSFSEFYCRSGVPLELDIRWPAKHIVNRAATYVHVFAKDKRNPSFVAKSSVIIDYSDYELLTVKIPFHRDGAVVNALRHAVDRGTVKFHREADRLGQIPQIPLLEQLGEARGASDEDLEEFISGKVYWLGFKQGDKRTKLWVKDPWDAEYLQVKPNQLAQAAQVLEARGEIVLYEDGIYASAGQGLLARGGPFTPGSQAVKPTVSAREGSFRWDAFICHASEDKESFVQRLAEEIRRRDLRVWYDDFAVKVGDSLRLKIDEGLASSRFGVVVLSPAFFAKDWPQYELDGLVEREMDGLKVILPVWHNVTKGDVRGYSPSLSNRVAANSREGIQVVVDRLLDAMGLPPPK